MVVSSTRKKTHSMAQPKTKLWMRVLVASGWVRPMANQMPTPETVPKTPVRRRKNCCGGLAGPAMRRRGYGRVQCHVSSSQALRSAIGRNKPPPTANWEIITWKIAMRPMTEPEPRSGIPKTDSSCEDSYFRLVDFSGIPGLKGETWGTQFCGGFAAGKQRQEQPQILRLRWCLAPTPLRKTALNEDARRLLHCLIVQ